MPFWQNNIVPDPMSPQYNTWITIPYHRNIGGTQNHSLPTTVCEPSWYYNFNVQDVLRKSHWDMIVDYDIYMVDSAHTGYWDNYRKLQQPPNIWYVDKPDVNGFGFFDSPGVWYNETVQEVVEKQTLTMSNYEIDFVIYDWFWSYIGPDHCTGEQLWGPYWEGTQKHWLNPNFNNNGLDMAIYWAGNYANLVEPDVLGVGGNPDEAEGLFGSGNGLNKLIDRVGEYMLSVDANSTMRYKLKEGKNVFYLDWGGLTGLLDLPSVQNHSFFSGQNGLIPRATHLLNYIEARLLNITGRNTYFVALVSERGPTDTETFGTTWRYNQMVSYPIQAGFDAISTYNYKVYNFQDVYDWDSDNPGPIWQWNIKDDYDYGTMLSVYSRFYNYYKNNMPSAIEYQVPVTEGWNRAPLNMREAGGGDTVLQYPQNPDTWNLSHLKEKSYQGLKDNEFKKDIWDNAASTPSLYNTALTNAKTFIDQNQSLTDKTVLLCCWNEHGEGTTIEPSYAWGYDYLQKIVDVFNPIVEVEDPEPPGPPLKASDSYFGEEADNIPTELMINQNFPNPFRESTSITYGVPTEGKVEVQIFDTNNRLVMVLVNEIKNAGMHTVEWDASTNKSGIYIGQIIHNGIQKTIKMVLTK